MNTMKSFFVKRPEVAELTRKIVATLVGVNDELADTALSQVVGTRVGPNTYALRAALRDLARADPPVHFRRIKNMGWKRMHDPDLVAHSEVDLKKITRGARRGRKRLSSVRFDALSKNDQLQAARNNTRFSAIEDTASNATVRRPPSPIPDLNDLLKRIKAEHA